MLLIFLGFGFGMGIFYGVMCLAVGSFLVGSVNHRAVYLARRTIRSLKGIYPKVQYCFNGDSVSVMAGKNSSSVNYNVLIRLIDDGKSLYLCPSSQNAFVINKSDLDINDINYLKEYLSQKTGLQWQTPGGLWGANIYILLKMLKK